MRLQTASRIALYAVLALARNADRQLSAADIAAMFDVSLNHLAKVLRDLNRAKMVEAVRGAGGGYKFCGNVKRTTLYDIIAVFEDIGQNADTMSPEGHRTEIGSGLAVVLQEIDDIASSTLKSITIETMLNVIER